MLHKNAARLNMSFLMSQEAETTTDGLTFVTRLLTSIYVTMITCVLLLILRILYVAILRRLLDQPNHRPTSNQV